LNLEPLILDNNINPIPKSATDLRFGHPGKNLPDLFLFAENGSYFQLLNSCHRKGGRGQPQ
jgi:hypothetical protein